MEILLERSQGISAKICHILATVPSNRFINTKLCATSSRNTSNPNGFYFNRLIGPLETTAKGNQYTLTVIYMLTNYITCIPTPDTSADIGINAYVKEAYCRFRGS